jgi:hypothetical protein
MSLLVGFIPSLLFGPEDGSDMFLQKVGDNHMMLYLIRLYVSFK